MDVKKKRGRKPKNQQIIKTDNIIEEVDTEKECIICHIPVSLEEINNTSCLSLFIKEDNMKEKKQEKNKLLDNISEIKNIQSNETQSETIKNVCNTINKISTYTIKFTKNTKCWWCKNKFLNTPIQLPENYYNETFYCIGNFCSFNCVKSYNLDLNDSLKWYRESLIHLLYNLTYNEYKEIAYAPHWLTLEDYGGNLSIEEFRKNSIINTTNFLILHPPLISRQMQIEESYKVSKLKEVSLDNINKLYSEMDSDFTIKRTKPIQSSQLNLATTMGLIKKK
jgi:hypothetical protein